MSYWSSLGWPTGGLEDTSSTHSNFISILLTLVNLNGALKENYNFTQRKKIFPFDLSSRNNLPFNVTDAFGICI